MRNALLLPRANAGMKKFLSALIIAVSVYACQNSSPVGLVQSSMKDQIHQFDSSNYTAIQWLDSIVNFGTVTRGEKVHVSFRFKNSGGKPLFLAEVKPSCGCTVAEYTKGAVAPGRQGEIKAEFDSNHGFAGKVRKTIRVTSNTKNQQTYTLIFTGEVKDTTVKAH